MKRIYHLFCTAEELICGLVLCIIVSLAFATALARTIGRPISWTVEISQFFLAWLAFLGADMGLRHGRVNGVDLLTRRLPVRVQAVIKIVTDLIILALLLAMVKFGFDLCASNWKRSYKTVGISYSWATAACPVSAVFMSVTIALEIAEQIGVLCGKPPRGKEETV